jgi:serine phosphatase RsbU (regulator of sigma subunit)
VPVVTKRGVVGAMQFVSAESGRHYDSSDVALAEAAAGRVGAALDNAWLFEEQQQISSTLQSALLPAELPAVDGVDVAVRYWAAGSLSEVGGDFYDVFSIGERRWAFVIGDVCGTGPAAAAVTAVARHTIRAAATHGASHLQVLNWVNDAILNGTTGLFCTVLYSTLEFTADGQWVFTSIAGGHPLPILSGVKSVDETGSAATMLGTHGTLIGVLPTLDVTPHAVVLEPGSTVVLHTDGINDVRPPHALDDAALRDLVAAAAARSSSAEDVAEHIGAAIADVLPIAQRDDDMAIVVLRIN